MEMVGDRNPRGELLRGEARAEWRRLSDRAYSPLCFRSQVRPAGFSFPPVLYTQAFTLARPTRLARARTYTHLQCARENLPPFSGCVGVHTERPSSAFHPRGRLVDLPFRLPRYTALGAVTRALRCRALSSLVLFLSLSLALDCYISSVSGTAPRRTAAFSACLEGIRQISCAFGGPHSWMDLVCDDSLKNSACHVFSD